MKEKNVVYELIDLHIYKKKTSVRTNTCHLTNYSSVQTNTRFTVL